MPNNQKKQGIDLMDKFSPSVVCIQASVRNLDGCAEIMGSIKTEQNLRRKNGIF